MSALKDHIKNDVDTLKQDYATQDKQVTPLQGIDSAITRIDHFVSESVDHKSDNYFEEKRQHLQNFEQDIKKRTDISGTERRLCLMMRKR